MIRLLGIIALALSNYSVTSAWEHLLDGIKGLSELTQLRHNRTSNYDKGFLMCAGHHLLPDMILLIYDLRIVWRLHLPIAVSHCDELSDRAKHILRPFGNIQFIDICQPYANGNIHPNLL